MTFANICSDCVIKAVYYGGFLFYAGILLIIFGVFAVEVIRLLRGENRGKTFDERYGKKLERLYVVSIIVAVILLSIKFIGHQI